MVRVLPFRLLIVAAFVVAQGCGVVATDLPLDSGTHAVPDAGERADAGRDAGIEGPDAGAPDAGIEVPDAGRPGDAGVAVDGIVFVHGIRGSSADWNAMVARFKADGWDSSRLIVETFSDPSWGCNAANASVIAGWVQRLKTGGARRVAVVAHSMGGLSSRHYLKQLGGTSDVAVFVTLGTMHHGLSSPCLSPLPVCVWQELCESGSFMTALNMAPATPGPTLWTSVFSTDDGTVPAASSQLTGADNIQLMGLTHSGAMGLQDSAAVYDLVLNALK